MTDATWVLIQWCWAILVVCWVAMAFATKRTIERKGFIGYRIVTSFFIGAWLLVGRVLHESTQSQLWTSAPAVGVAADLVVLAGLGMALWARLTLGRNWSAEVTYALVRHPTTQA
jgi:hypothetical protein